MAVYLLDSHCICGASLTGKDTDPHAAQMLRDYFWQMHTGPRHAAATAVQARRARVRQYAEPANA